MSDKISVHWSFWVIGVVTLIWNLMGVINFFMQMNPETLAAMPESHRAVAEARPIGITASFGISVFSGALGCLLLLLRKPAAYYLFILSLVSMIVTMVHAFGFSDSAITFNLFETVLAVWMPLALAAFLIWYSKWIERKGWLH